MRLMLNKQFIIFAVLSFCLAAASIWFDYLSGCTGDIKTGASGDPVKALEYETKGFIFSLLSSICLGIAVFLKVDANILTRVSKGLSYAFLTIIILHILSF